MEKLASTLARKFYLINKEIEYSFKITDYTPTYSKIKYLIYALIPISGILSFSSSVAGDFFIDQVLLFFSYLIFAGFLFFLTDVYLKLKGFYVQKAELIPFKELRLNRIDGKFLKLNKQELLQFQLLILEGKVDKKIDWKFHAKKDSQPNFKFLFCLIQFISQNGISDIDVLQTKHLYQLIQNSFLALGSEINEASLDNSFFNWKLDFKNGNYKSFMNSLERSFYKE